MILDESESEDEISEIKRVMREAKKRKKFLLERQRGKWKDSSIEKDEYEEVMRKIRDECDEWRKKASELEFDLREARYEITQWTNKYSRLESEKEHQEGVYKNQIQDIQLKIEAIVRQDDEKLNIITIECDKLTKVFDALCRNYEFSQSQTNQHILSKAKTFLQKIKEFASTPDLNLHDYRQKIVLGSRNKESQQLITVDSAVDNAMLEMCRNLEEENTTLHETVNSLKEQLAECKRESAASQLIPHYRLAIVRSRTYAANLLEQIKREQETSKTLREQLDETYRDLKEVVEEKRKLYKKISKKALEDAELTMMKEETFGLSGEREEKKRYQEKRHLQLHHQEKEKGRERKRSDRYPDGEVEDEEDIRQSYSSSNEKSRRHKPCGSHRHHHHYHTILEDERARKKKEESLLEEIDALDATIEKMKEKLSQAALAQSQKILNEVLANNAEDIQV